MCSAGVDSPSWDCVGLDTHPDIDATSGLGELLRLPFAPHQVASGRDEPIPVAAID